MLLTRSRLTAWLAAAASALLVASPAGAQITLTAAPGVSPLPSFFNRYTAVAYNSFNGLPNGTTQVQFGAIGSGVLDGASVQGNQVFDVDQDGQFGLRFSRPVAGLFAGFDNGGSSLVLTFLNQHATVATLSTVLTRGQLSYVGISGLTFDAVRVAGPAARNLRMDEMVVGINGGTPSVGVTATPEPATVALVGLGLAGLGLVGRRRSRAAR